ncbi:unnamed protein product [Rotaria sordida]|uniref:Uncharacterized protein n=1 Tax=Rotaria sordida TaxID=392033 RepID=A0A815D0Q9_9BILA|nr:unnamed protein product [Rotaria sordida]CAF1290877.1 unnamed protein product [Rotaria sordida]CAF3568584.1 unnamed protein product [Rotaria sordida]
MSEKDTIHFLSNILSRRFFVRKRNIIDSLSYPSISIAIMTEKSILSSNQNCCGNDEKKVQVSSVRKSNPRQTKDNIVSTPNEFIIEIPKQTKPLEVVSNEKLPLYYEIISNAWPLSSEHVENLIISNKRCQFSNEAISIKPITAVPGIGKKYGQLLADHGFIYARQLLGYYMMLKDSEMFRKWLEYKFNIPRFRAAEITSALNELIRRTL